jgi:uncharacterized membrane protein YeaQ/YmgE (transglycosylase-associated protein family)
MYILVWIIVGLAVGWLTGKLLAEGEFKPTMDIVTGIVGAIGGGFIMRLISSPAHGGLGYTSLAATLGAALLTGINASTNFGKRSA